MGRIITWSLTALLAISTIVLVLALGADMRIGVQESAPTKEQRVLLLVPVGKVLVVLWR